MKFDNLIDEYVADIVVNIQNLVRIKSVEEKSELNMPFGLGPYKALSYVLDLGEKLGFVVKNIDNYAGHIEYGSGDDIVGILAHVDVVPEGEGWTMDPFCGDVIDGKIYGRGSYDDKGACIASIYALKALKESGVNLNKKIRLIFGANEETGMKDIPYYLSKEKEPSMAFSPDSPFPVIYGEKGILNVRVINKLSEKKYIKRLHGGTSIKLVPSQCEVELELDYLNKLKAIEALEKIKDKYNYSYSYDNLTKLFEIKIFGKTASGSRPYEGVNAISGMMLYLSYLDFLDNDFKNIINHFNTKIGLELDGRSMECDFKDDISTPLTLNVGTVSMNEDIVNFDIQIRYPVLTDYNTLLDNLIKYLNNDISYLQINDHSPAHYISKESQLVKTLMSIYSDYTGDINSSPVTMEGGTYARTLKNAVGFGPLFPGEKQVAHGPDEYVNIESLIKACKIYAKSLYELSK